MQTYTPIQTGTRLSKFSSASILFHASLAALLLYHHIAYIAPMRLPGTAHGTHVAITYLPGRIPVQAALKQTAPPPKLTATVAPVPPPVVQPHPAPVTSPNTQSSTSPTPDPVVGNDALGSGNLQIASTTFSPSPKPDLSTLPRGTRGNVILDIVIDTTGKISDIKKIKGLGPGVDQNVIATVQQWTFKPATLDGKPVASEQELLFYYES